MKDRRTRKHQKCERERERRWKLSNNNILSLLKNYNSTVVQHLLDTKLCKKREKERMIKKEKVWRVEDKIECYIYIINVGGERRSLKSVDSN